MKHGKKPTHRQGLLMEENGFNPREYFVVKDTSTETWIVAREGDQSVITLFKEKKETPLDFSKGEWKINFDGYYPYCSLCGCEPKNGVMSNFCPDCGADMR